MRAPAFLVHHHQEFKDQVEVSLESQCQPLCLPNLQSLPLPHLPLLPLSLLRFSEAEREQKHVNQAPDQTPLCWEGNLLHLAHFLEDTA